MRWEQSEICPGVRQGMDDRFKKVHQAYLELQRLTTTDLKLYVAQKQSPAFGLLIHAGLLSY